MKDYSFGPNEKKKRRLTSADKKRIAAKQDYKCKCCGVGLRTVYHIDHIKPFSKGGSDMEHNLQALCPNCHAEKTEEERHKEKQRKLKQEEGAGEGRLGFSGSGLFSVNKPKKSADSLDWLVGKRSKKSSAGFGNSSGLFGGSGSDLFSSSKPKKKADNSFDWLVGKRSKRKKTGFGF